jgi:GT2 family glycosyltransferase
VILPTYNEGQYIAATLQSLIAQQCDEIELEFLVIDGGSSDETLDCIMPFLANPRVKLLNNPARSAPAAFNIGLRMAAGEYVCILGAHASYAHDYVETCYRELLSNNAIGCSGRMITVPVNNSLSAKLAAWCMGHAFASSPTSVRTHAGGFAETIPYPLFRKAVLIEVGGYNEQLVRNQDNDMNYRLRAAGHKLYLTARTHATYFARPSVKSLLQYAYRSGMWNAITLRVNLACMNFRHFAPFALVMVNAVLAVAASITMLMNHSALLPLSLLLLLLGSHLLFGLIAGAQVSLSERNAAGLLLALVIFGFHFAYGLGTLAGFFASQGVLPVRNASVAPLSAKSAS